MLSTCQNEWERMHHTEIFDYRFLTGVYRFRWRLRSGRSQSEGFGTRADRRCPLYGDIVLRRCMNQPNWP